MLRMLTSPDCGLATNRRSEDTSIAPGACPARTVSPTCGVKNGYTITTASILFPVTNNWPPSRLKQKWSGWTEIGKCVISRCAATLYAEINRSPRFPATSVLLSLRNRTGRDLRDLTVYTRQAVLYEATSDSGGTFQIFGIKPGDYEVRFGL